MEDSTMWDNLVLMALLIWPAVVVGCALLNMFISWTFSWSELIMDYFIGVLTGLFFHLGTHGDVNAAEHVFLVVSHGPVGLLKWLGVEALADPRTLFAASASAMGGATVLSAALDHVPSAVGVGVASSLLSVIQLPIKLAFTVFTPAVGLVIMLIGVIVRAASSKKSTDPWFALAGGALFFGWGRSGRHATTFGWVVNAFEGDIGGVVKHELYHTRQYIYMHDWLGIFYFTFGALWGLISAKIDANRKKTTFDAAYAFRGKANGGEEVGNPIEIAAYRL